jgi:hypothetical protein
MCCLKWKVDAKQNEGAKAERMAKKTSADASNVEAAQEQSKASDRGKQAIRVCP